MSAASPAPPGQYITFFVAGDEYAVGILRAQEIVEYTTITRVPMAPPAIRGMMNLRGRVVPVIDLAKRFGLGDTEVNRWTCILIIDVELDRDPTRMGVLVDSVSDVIELAPKDIEPPPAFGTRIRPDYLLAVGKAGERLVMVLDMDRILSLEGLLGVAALVPRADADSALPPHGSESGLPLPGKSDDP